MLHLHDVKLPSAISAECASMMSPLRLESVLRGNCSEHPTMWSPKVCYCDMERSVALLNIELFQRRLAVETDATKLRTLQCLLVEEEAKLGGLTQPPSKGLRLLSRTPNCDFNTPVSQPCFPPVHMTERNAQ